MHFKVAVYALLVSIIFKLTIFTASLSNELTVYGYMLAVLLSIFIVQRAENKAFDVQFLTFLKSGVKVGALYAVGISLFTYLYYTQINVEYFADKIADRIAQAEEQGYSEKDIAKVKANVEQIYSGMIHSSITLMAFLFVSFIYSALVGAMFKFVPAFKNL